MNNEDFCAYSTHDDTIDGFPVYCITLNNSSMRVVLTNMGCSIMAIYVPNKNGEQQNVVAGFDVVAQYATNPHYLGCTLGRFAGRITHGQYYLDGRLVQLTQNDGESHLHGGFKGFSKRVWEVLSLINTPEYVAAKMSYTSPDGEEGCPGEMVTTVEFRLYRTDRLELVYSATVSKACPVSISNHAYFDLSGCSDGSVLNHSLQIDSAFYLEKNKLNQPSGNIIAVDGTALDFRTAKALKLDIDQFPDDMGFNHTFVLKSTSSADLIKAAVLTDNASGRVMTVFTDQPALQVYTANYWNDDEPRGVNGPYGQHGAIALETQAYTDAPNHANFPDTVLRPGKEYYTNTVFEFMVMQ